MERRRDYRHLRRYPLSLKVRRTTRVIDRVETADVSASGLRFEGTEPHGLAVGERIEVQVTAVVEGRADTDALVMATSAVVVRATNAAGALRFEAPLTY